MKSEHPSHKHADRQPFSAPLAVTIKIAAQLMGCSPKSVRRLIARGLLKPCRALRTPLIPVKQIDALLEENS